MIESLILQSGIRDLELISMNRFQDRSTSTSEHYRARTVVKDKKGKTQLYQAFSPRGSREHRLHVYQGNPMEHLDHISARYQYDVGRPQPLSPDINRRIENMRRRAALNNGNRNQAALAQNDNNIQGGRANIIQPGAQQNQANPAAQVQNVRQDGQNQRPQQQEERVRG